MHVRRMFDLIEKGYILPRKGNPDCEGELQSGLVMPAAAEYWLEGLVMIAWTASVAEISCLQSANPGSINQSATEPEMSKAVLFMLQRYSTTFPR